MNRKWPKKSEIRFCYRTNLISCKFTEKFNPRSRQDNFNLHKFYLSLTRNHHFLHDPTSFFCNLQNLHLHPEHDKFNMKKDSKITYPETTLQDIQSYNVYCIFLLHQLKIVCLCMDLRDE